MLYKNLPDKDLKRVFRVRFLLDLIAAAKFLAEGHPANAKAVFQARRDFTILKKDYLPVREYNLRKSTGRPLPEISNNSLLLSYYMKKRKLYSQIPTEI
jgi:hypothetical protein